MRGESAEWARPRRGSRVELAGLFVPADHARLFLLLEGLRDAVLSAATASADPGVTAVKLGWWHEELNRFAGGGARHPLTRALQPQAAQAELEPGVLTAWIAAAETLASGEPVTDGDELLAFLRHRDGTALLAYAMIAVRSSEAQERQRHAREAVRAGTALGVARLLDEAREHGRARRLFPRAWVADAGLVGRAPEDWPGERGFAALQRRAAGAGLAELAKAQPHDAPPMVGVLAALAGRHLRKIRRRPGRPPGRLTRVFTAWRAARAGRHAHREELT